MEAILSGAFKKRPEFYESLGCDKLSSAEQITCEYRARVRDFHPDKVSDLNEEFLALQRAYDVLSDAEQRKIYDMWLESPLNMSFDEFCRNSGTLKMSMHWVIPRSTPMISPPDNIPVATASHWGDMRYNSDAARRFRNYEI